MDAFGRLVEAHQDRLFNALYRLVHDYEDARELTQQAFVRALQGLRRFRGQAKFYTWLMRIGTNLAFNHLRRKPVVPFSVLHGDDDRLGGQAAALRHCRDDRTPGPLQQAALREDHERVLAGLARLDLEAKAIIVLRDVDELSYEEIAAVLEVPVGTVKSRLFRARQALRDLLG
jgi:RNA polymerase sigma-70 factor (ECF subfamily)